MTQLQTTAAGFVAGLWRYPVKSMGGEQLARTRIDQHGLLGDRTLALVDKESEKIASAKNPRRWPNLFDFQASFLADISTRSEIPPARITFPDGQILTTDRSDIEARLSAAVGREVRLAQQSLEGAKAEGYWPDYDWLADRNEVFEYELPPGTFFDGAPIHLLTTGTLAHLSALAPNCRFEVPRFRPNILIDSSTESPGFIENGWVGRTLAVGDVRLHVERPCPRCVMTTLAQGFLPKETEVLRTAVLENGGNVGVYASVIQGGTIQQATAVELL
jgi:uncharacterized protein YcbX